MTSRRSLLGSLLLVGALFSSGCKGESSASAQGGSVSLNGAGATFPYPLYSKWISEYNRAHPDVRINYQSIGSGGGIRQIVAGTVDFGATDAPMSEEEAKKASGPLVHIPTTLGAVAVAYNLKDVVALKLAPDVLADMFLGKIKQWNDERIVALNPGSTLPDLAITVVFRSDGSGTTAVFSDYLATVSPEWKSSVGQGKSLKWPSGLGAKGNEGVTGQIKTTAGAIGYVEFAYASEGGLQVASLKNHAGEFVAPSIPAVTAAAAGAPLPDTLHASIVDAKGKGAYPIAAYTYLLVQEDTKDKSKGQALARFLWWAIHDGQVLGSDLHYAPLPDPVIKQVEARLKQLRAGGEPALSGA